MLRQDEQELTLAKRIIPCLDVKDGCVVKGKQFGSIGAAGDPVKLARNYRDQGADELVFLDISASLEGRKTKVKLAREVAEELDIPFTIGGGISSVQDARTALSNGADKVSVNTAALERSQLISDLNDIFGQQCVVVALDAKRSPRTKSGFAVCSYGGSFDTGRDVLSWVREVEEKGAGEILLTSIDRDGTKLGFDLDLTSLVCSNTQLPVIASGGCGKIQDFLDILSETKTGGRGRNADAALAASVFHYGELTIGKVKEFLKAQGINVRI